MLRMFVVAPREHRLQHGPLYLHREHPRQQGLRRVPLHPTVIPMSPQAHPAPVALRHRDTPAEVGDPVGEGLPCTTDAETGGRVQM